MANFVDCWNQLKSKGYKHADGSEVLNEQDRASIEKRIQEHLKTGLDPLEAAKASVKSHLDEAHTQLQSVYDQVGVQPVSEAGQAPAVAGQPKTEGGIGEEKVQVQGQEKGRILAGDAAETPAAAVPPETPEQLGQALSEKPRLAGPSNRVLQERALRGEIPQAPESGIGVLKEDLIKQANERYSPERSQLAAQKALRGESNLADEADIVLHEEKLTKAAADAERALKSNPNDLSLQQAYQSARNAMTDWQHGPIAAIKTTWANKGINLQGATDVDTGTLVGLQKLAWDTGKGDFTPEQRPVMDEAANRVTRAQAEEKASIAKANDAVQKVLKPSRYMDLNQLRESLATTLKSMTC